MQAEDIPSLHELSLSVRWPHRAEDWAELQKVGEGFVARDLIGRLICSMMWFPMGSNYASVGMGISSPRLQSLGAGRWLAQHVGQEIGDRNVFLNATGDSLRLCLSFNFQTVRPVFHHNGLAETNSRVLPRVAQMQTADFEAIEQLDAVAMGFNRRRIIPSLLAVSEGTLIRESGDITGFALCRKFGRGRVIGPIVAANEDDAIALIDPFIKANPGVFFRVDTYQDSGPFRDYLVEAGITLHETATMMVRGSLPSHRGNAITFGLASQAFG
ncbi:MAG: N-acetyltransferase [Pseudomonadota bacterium]